MKAIALLILASLSVFGSEKEKPEIEKSKDYTSTPIVDFHYQIIRGYITDITKYKGKVLKLDYYDRTREFTEYDGALRYSSKYGDKYALFMVSGRYRGVQMSVEVVIEIDPKKMYVKSSPPDLGYYKLKGTTTYNTVGGGKNTVFVFDKFAPLVEKKAK